MINKKKSPRILAVKYLLAVPALAATLLTIQVSGLQARETDGVNTLYENTDRAEAPVLSATESDEIKLPATEATVQESRKPQTVVKKEIVTRPDLGDHVQYSDSGKLKFIDGLKIRNSLGHPLIILDGKIIPNEELDKIDSKTIESVSVLKNKAATDLFGEKAINGVIMITSKTKTDSAIPQDTFKIEPTSDYRIRQGTPHIPEGNEIPKATLISDDLRVDVMDTETQSKIGTVRIIMSNNQELGKDIPVLYVVDGEKFENIDNLSVESIESISILKGPSAIAVYGEKGKNGVVLITTKK